MSAEPPFGACSAFRAVVCLATGLMLGLSWPLWVEPSAIPRVPFAAAIPAVPPLLSWLIFFLIMASLGGAAVGVRSSALLGGAALLLAGLVLGDQHRLQAWVYQFLLLAVALATTAPSRALGLARALAIALYIHSGLSKLDVSFAGELGPQFLKAGADLLGLGLPDSERTRRLLAWALPGFEIFVGLLLAYRPTRRLGLAGAVALHASLLVLLGPLGMRHSAIVLIWNAAMLVEAVLLFGPATIPVRWRRLEGDTPLYPLAVALFALAAVLPLGERFGWYDSWPSFALYASHVERAEVLIAEDEIGGLGPHLQPFLIGGPPGWRHLDLTAWSRAVRGVPVYPQNRAALGVAIGLLGRPDGPRWPGVILWGRASAFAGRRDRVELYGPEAIGRYADRHRWNARPAAAATTED